MQEPLLSIIIPVYNCEKYVRRCIESLDPARNKNIEIIIVDDGSTDRSLDICIQFQAQKQNIHIISQENKGVSCARNSGIEYASGKWIMFLDADDYLDKDAVENCLQYIRNTKAELFCFGRYISLYDEHEENLIQERKEPFREFKETKSSTVYFDVRKNFIEMLHNSVWDSSCAKCFLRSVIVEEKIKFDIEMTVREDSEFVVQYLKHINIVQIVDKCWYHYRIIGFENRYHIRRKIKVEDIKKYEQTCREYLKAKEIDTKQNNNLISRHVFMLLMVGITQLCAGSLKYPFKELYMYSVKMSNLFHEMLQNIHYGSGFYDFLIWLLKNRCYLLFCLICKMRLFNSVK